MMPRIPRALFVKLVAVITLGSGLINLYSLIGPGLHQRLAVLREVFPLEFIHLSRFLTLLIGFTLVISAINVYKRKKRAFYGVLILSGASIAFHLTKGFDYEEASASLVLIVALLAARKQFTVRSSIPSWHWGLLRLGLAAIIALGYGVIGFWLLEPRHFGVDFHWGDALRETLKYLAFFGSPPQEPLTRYAHWFIDSLYVMTVTATVYALYALFRPVVYQFREHPRERALAREIVERHGRSAMDYFKFWPDKSYFFSASQNSVIAYRVANNFAITLGDPVGPEEEIEETIRDFMTLCSENGWRPGFHQTLPDFIPIYERLGFRKFKLGDDAIVDLATFNLDGHGHKEFRRAMRRIEESGVHAEGYSPPISAAVLGQIREVSEEWLRIPGRRERQFTLGTFELHYVRSTPVFAAVDQQGRIAAFANIIPSYHPGEATIDLMRRQTAAPNGIMDYLFIKLMFHLQSQGFRRFNLGLAPMSGFRKDEPASADEKAIHYIFQHLSFLFSYRGLWHYKAKFASFWEPRYLIYQSPLDLPRMAMALREVSEVKRRHRRAALPEDAASIWPGPDSEDEDAELNGHTA